MKEAFPVGAVPDIIVNASSLIRSSSQDQRMVPAYTYMNEANSHSEEDRVHYMERILHYHLPHLPLDVASLRTAADQLQSQRHRGSSGSVDVEDLDDLTIDDEEFVIKPMPDDTTQYSGEFSYLNFSMKIRRKIDEWIKAAAPEVFLSYLFLLPSV